MAEPISLITTIGGLSITIVKLICSISQYVDEVREASAEVQRLQNELTSFYASLGQIKLAIETPRNTPIPESWTKSFTEMLNDCEETVKMLDEIVEKSKKDEKKVRAKQVWRSVKFTFKKGQADEIRKRLMSYNQLLGNMLLVLADLRGVEASSTLEEIRKAVEELAKSREHVKEILVVLEKNAPNESEAHFTLNDRTSRDGEPRDQKEKETQPISNPSNSGSPHEEAKKLLDNFVANFKTWKLQLPNEKNLRRRPPELHVQIPLTNIIAVEVVQVDERVTRLQYYQRHEGIPNYWIVDFHEVTTLAQNIVVLKSKGEVWTYAEGIDKGFPHGDSLLRLCFGGPQSATYEFVTNSDAKEFYDCLSSVEKVYRRCWEKHTIAFAPVHNLDITTPQKLRLAAAYESLRCRDRWHIPWETG